MSTNPDSAASIGASPEADDVTARAEGRPPEEWSSDDPEAQAEAILMDSEDRIAEGAEGSDVIAE
jgi:hypothetical protein